MRTHHENRKKGADGGNGNIFRDQKQSAKRSPQSLQFRDISEHLSRTKKKEGTKEILTKFVLRYIRTRRVNVLVMGEEGIVAKDDGARKLINGEREERKERRWLEAPEAYPSSARTTDCASFTRKEQA